MTLAIEYFNAAGTATADGVFIPLASLPGVLASELAGAEAIAQKEGKTVLAILNRIYNIASPNTFSKLGLEVSKESPSGISADIFNQSFSVTYQKLVNLDTDTISVVPIPTSGANSGVGGFSIADIFSGAAKVAAAGAVSGAGVVIKTSGLLPYSSLTHASINPSGDSRDWIFALIDHLVADSDKRSASIASAVTSGTVGRLFSPSIPSTYIAATDPVSGILADDLNSRGLIGRINAITVQIQLNQTTQTFDVFVATN
jgi:hypothetical protein